MNGDVKGQVIGGKLSGVGKRRENVLGEPPKVMTWSKASPVLVVAVVFWLLRVVFEMFWFFGPAIAALGCTVAVNSATGVSVAQVGGKVAATACTGVGAAIGFFGVEFIEPFGVIMAMIVGFFGWLVVGLLILLTNRRVFKEDPQVILWLVGALGFDEIPIIGALPGLVTAVFRTYHKQIANDKKMLREYEAAVATQKEQERQEKIAQFNQFQALQQARAQEEADEIDQEEQAQEEDLSRDAVNAPDYGVHDGVASGAEYTQESEQAA